MRTPRTTHVLAATTAALALVLTACAHSGGTGGFTGGTAQDAGTPSPNAVKIGLVTKTDANPYFVRMREAAIAAADRHADAVILPRAGRFDGDNDGQVAAVEDLLANGVRGILITPSDSVAIVGELAKARARGVLVIALDTATTPATAVDATYATGNYIAGWKQGLYLRQALGSTPPRLAMIDGAQGGTSSAERHQGFLRGFGLVDGAPEIVGSAATNADHDSAAVAMVAMLDAHPDVNAVYTINEPAAAGVTDVLSMRDRSGRIRVASIDGSCPGVLAVRGHRYAATVMQFPDAMVERGVDAVTDFAARGALPEPGVTDTGSQVIATSGMPSVAAQDTDWGLRHCWG